MCHKVRNCSKTDETEVKVKVTQSCLTLSDPMDYTVHGILQARILEWAAFLFSRGSSHPGIKPRFPALQVDSLPAELPEKPNHFIYSSVDTSMSSLLVCHCQSTKCPPCLSSRQPSSPGNHHDPFKMQIKKLNLSPKGKVHYRIF